MGGFYEALELKGVVLFAPLFLTYLTKHFSRFEGELHVLTRVLYMRYEMVFGALFRCFRGLR